MWMFDSQKIELDVLTASADIGTAHVLLQGCLAGSHINCLVLCQA